MAVRQLSAVCFICLTQPLNALQPAPANVQQHLASTREATRDEGHVAKLSASNATLALGQSNTSHPSTGHAQPKAVQVSKGSPAATSDYNQHELVHADPLADHATLILHQAQRRNVTRPLGIVIVGILLAVIFATLVACTLSATRNGGRLTDECGVSGLFSRWQTNPAGHQAPVRRPQSSVQRASAKENLGPQYRFWEVPPSQVSVSRRVSHGTKQVRFAQEVIYAPAPGIAQQMRRRPWDSPFACAAPSTEQLEPCGQASPLVSARGRGNPHMGTARDPVDAGNTVSASPFSCASPDLWREPQSAHLPVGPNPNRSQQSLCHSEKVDLYSTDSVSMTNIPPHIQYKNERSQ